MKSKAIILADGYFGTPFAKTAHGLVKLSYRYDIVGVIDSNNTGKDAGEVLNGIKNGIRIYPSLSVCLQNHPDARFLIIGIAVAGGALPESYIPIIKSAIQNNLSIINGLHRFLSDDPEINRLAMDHGVELIDVRKIFNQHRVGFSGKIRDVTSTRIAVLGCDGIIGKRTTAIQIHEALSNGSNRSAFVAMGQTGWMQGFPYAVVIDSILLAFVTGAIEDAVWRAWKEQKPDYIVTHGEGAMLHPSDPGGFDLIAGARPDHIILQCDPCRTHYACYPDFELPPLERELDLIRAYTGKQPIALTLYTHGIDKDTALETAKEIELKFNIITRVPCFQGVGDIVDKIYRHSKDKVN